MLCCVVLCCVVLCCVVLCCVVWCVARLGTEKKPPCVDSKRPRVYRHHAHVCYHMRAWCRYTRGRLESTHGGFLDGHTGERGGKEGEERGVTVSSANHETVHVELSRASERFTERNPWFLPIQGLRPGREQHVLESSNHSLYLTKLLSSSNLEGQCGGNQHTQHTQSPTQRHKHQHKDTTQHTHTHTHQHILTNPPTHPPTTTLLSSPLEFFRWSLHRLGQPGWAPSSLPSFFMRKNHKAAKEPYSFVQFHFCPAVRMSRTSSGVR